MAISLEQHNHQKEKMRQHFKHERLKTQIVMAWLVTSIDLEIGQTYMFLSTTKEMWDAVNETFSDLVRETLLSWQTSSVGKKHRKVWRAAPLHIFWTVWKARNRLAFKDDVISIQRLKYSFLCSLWSEAKLFIVECPQTLVNFIDWVRSL